MDRWTIAGVLQEIKKYFHVKDSSLGLLQTVFICSFMLLAPLFGYLGDRYSRKIIMCVGLVIWSGITLGSSFVTESYYWLLLVTRGLVGIGEASYSTIAPTIIGDLFVKDKRTWMLSIFYICIPVGSGLGYILGSSVKQATGDWHWALRITPCLGVIALILLIALVPDPRRGAAEHLSEDMLARTSWSEDVKYLCANWSFMWSSLGVTAIAFVTGSLAFWTPIFLSRARIVQGTEAPCVDEPCSSSESLIFGAITVGTGVFGVLIGTAVASRWKKITPHADPLICAVGMLSSAPCLYLAIVLAQSSTPATYVFIALGETFLSLNWAIVADILLYVVIPTRRSTAEALQITLCHVLGDAGSPYLIGIISDAIQEGKPDSHLLRFQSLEYGFMLCTFVGVLGGGFFLLTAFFVKEDREKVEQFTKGSFL
ncbi:protein spinster homolog 3 [Latimeria chalumnae]|uniref:protein spinster homolog 3 n=1 Tax=Latimeria chalumnae TaxID=7897 RepID=UPI00313CB44F